MKIQGKRFLILVIFLFAAVGSLIWRFGESGAFGLDSADPGSHDSGAGSSSNPNRDWSNQSLPDRPRDRLISMEEYGLKLIENGIGDNRMEEYVESRGRSRDALIAAGTFAPGESAWLREAMEKFPYDPMVQFIAVTRDLVPEAERADWIARIKESQPDNALVSYLEAGYFLQSGEMEKGLESLLGAAGQAEYQDFGAAMVDLGEQMFLAMGESELDSRIRAYYGLPMPHFAQILGISEVITGIEGEESGSRPVATQEALIAGIQMGQRVREGGSTGSLLDPIVGLAVIKSFAQELDPGAQIPGRDVSSAEYLLELDSDLQRVEEMSNAVNSGSYPRSFVEEYVRRVRADGEIEAIEWFMENAPEPAPE